MKKDLYDQYQSLGLLDPNHTIGELYPSEKIQPLKKSYKELPVFFCSAPLKAYTIICAKCPDGYLIGTTMVMI